MHGKQDKLYVVGKLNVLIKYNDTRGVGILSNGF